MVVRHPITVNEVYQTIVKPWRGSWASEPLTRDYWVILFAVQAEKWGCILPLSRERKAGRRPLPATKGRRGQ